MDRRRARALLATGLSALLLAASVLVSSAAQPSEKRCNPRKTQCTTTETLPPSPTTTVPSSTTTTSTTAPADTTAPVTAITSPNTGSTVAGALGVTGTSRDDRSVARVEVRVDGGAWSAASGTTSWSMAVDTASWAPGSSHTVGARAVDAAGNTSAVSGVTVQKAATAPPPPTGDPSVAPATQGTWTSPEGVVIDVATTGSFTIRDIYRLLLENATAPGDLDRVGATLTIRVQDTYSSSTSTTAVGMPGAYTSVRSTIYLKGSSSTFSTRPDMQFAHEYGHAWASFHLYLGDGGDWNRYLTVRDLAGDPRMGTSYGWSRDEIIAEDYRLLFGSAAAVAQAPSHMNNDIAEPGDVPGLRDYLLGPFRTL